MFVSGDGTRRMQRVPICAHECKEGFAKYFAKMLRAINIMFSIRNIFENEFFEAKLLSKHNVYTLIFCYHSGVVDLV